MTFNELHLIDPILKALQTEGYTQPTPIQEQAIPVLLEGKDLLGCAQTGTGKTAAFAIPILQLLQANSRHEQGPKAIKALILTPTRELAIQIGESFAAYGKNLKLKHLVIYGGVSQLAQTTALNKGVDILIATPGRLLDLMNQKFIHLHKIQMFVLDEADRMLDMGFVNDVKKVISKLPEKRHSLFFSATMPPAIQQLADSILTNPVKVEVTPVSSTAEKINQSVYMVDKGSKRALLNHILEDKSIETALVFSRTKHGADRISRELNKVKIKAEAIHGDKSQNARQRALTNFKSKEIRVLVATDIAARGIDIDDLTHVINFDLPYEAETYVHRIGRTGRAGANGIALSFCDAEEMTYLKDIVKLIGKAIPTIEDHPFPLTVQRMLEVQDQQTQKKNDNRQKRGFSHNKNKGATQHSKKKQHRKGNTKAN
ncbi:DEAD/DEAH box helicase [Solitalea sp. MAHUQ-68]|uniref:DEAD-box ATP-dependent RNA helicase RhpA n=1 Tax=Solitalea agri TaxID=2953739 RepID=A0A9X2EZM5_9SPHI|nr:DEAD/DEAH box helicase [Solitalea agri]MCO4291989.1 DEAD/DEAH box helicase [Solitalea agri]